MKTVTALGLAMLGLGLAWVVAAAESPKVAAETKFDGVLLTRPDGRFLNLKIVDHHFVLVFLDEKKKPEEPDLQNGVVKYTTAFVKERRAIFSPSDDGQSLFSPQVIRSPFAYTIRVVLYKTGHPETAETYVAAFNQPSPDDGKTIPLDEMTPEQVQKIAK